MDPANPLNFELVPYTGIGPLRFGATRAEVRRTLGVPVEAFQKTPTAAALTDAFDDLGVHVHYDAADRCEAVELGGPRAAPSFEGKALLRMRREEARSWLAGRDPELRVSTTDLTSLKYGVALHTSSDEPEARVKSVLVFRRGYYD
jgi:hypothetical protein